MTELPEPAWSRHEVGLATWLRLEALAAQPVRASRWAVEPMSTARSATTVAAHIHIMHGEYTGSMDLRQLKVCHESLHDDPTFVMLRPHHHTGED